MSIKTVNIYINCKNVINHFVHYNLLKTLSTFVRVTPHLIFGIHAAWKALFVSLHFEINLHNIQTCCSPLYPSSILYYVRHH